MMSNYKNIRIIVIDDGSTDRTYKVARTLTRPTSPPAASTVLTKPNGGKAEALNYALQHIDEEIYVGIDADGVIAHDAIARLVCHFANPKIGAVAGNAKVGNRVNLWTRWQALEYITSQNFERRALDLFDVVMVVPGAIGAWRTAAVTRRRRLPPRHRRRRRRPHHEPARAGLLRSSTKTGRSPSPRLPSTPTA